MATSSSRRTNAPVLRSHSPSGRFYSPQPASASSAAFSSSPPAFYNRSTSPSRVNLYGSQSPSVRFSIDRSLSPSSSISSSSRNQVVRNPSHNPLSQPKRTCMCSPTNHPGSFRCSIHKNQANQTASYPSNRLNARRSAMTNSLVRIGTVEGDLVKRALAALIRPSSHHQKRRGRHIHRKFEYYPYCLACWIPQLRCNFHMLSGIVWSYRWFSYVYQAGFVAFTSDPETPENDDLQIYPMHWTSWTRLDWTST